MTQIKTKIPAELEPAAVGGMVTDSKYVKDRVKNKTQEEVNADTEDRVSTLEESVGTGGSVDERITVEKNRAEQAEGTLDGKITLEKQRAEGVEGGLNTRLQTVEQLAEISVGGGNIGIGTAADFESDDPEDLAKVPTIGAMLGGANDGVYDISARHSGATYADLAAALGENGANVPAGVRRGGMSVKFVQSSDNKYVQARLMANSFTTDTTKWQMIDDVPTEWSENLVKSGGVYKVLPKVYDKNKTYITIEVQAGLMDNLRSVYNSTNIKNETSGSCIVNFGDGSADVPITSQDSLDHTYTAAGRYEVVITGLTGLINNTFLRALTFIKEIKFGANFTNVGNYFMLNESTIDKVTFFAENPLTWGTVSANNMDSVTKIIVPKNSLIKYMDKWYKSSVSTNQDSLTKKIYPDEEVDFLYRDTVITVGTGGDYASINDAIQCLSQSYPLYKSGGIKASIKILSGTVINEQVLVDGLDLSWITIEYEDYTPESLNYDSIAESIADGTIVFDTTDGYNSVAIDASSWTEVTHDTRGDVCLFRAENGGRLPIINCVFKLTTPNSSYPVCGCLCNRGSEAVVKTLCGFIGFQDGVISNNESSITIREGITMNCSRWGCHARHNGEVSARSVIATGCATDTTKASEYGAAVADRVADMDVREAYLGGNYAIRCHNASSICARAAHVIGGGVENAYLVQATYSGKINASGMTFTGITEGSKMFEVLNAGWIDAFGVIDKTYNVSSLNAINGTNGIIWG